MPKKLDVTEAEVLAAYEANGRDVKRTHEALQSRVSIPTIYRYLARPKQETQNTVTQTTTVVTVGDNSLAMYIPSDTDTEIAGYSPRKDYLAALDMHTEAGRPALLIGEAGTGKTSLARYMAYLKKLPFLEVSCDSLLGFRELFGQVNITDGTSHFIEGLFTKFIQVPSIILLDEITALDPGKNFMLHQLLNSREFFVKEADRGKGKTYKLHPECRIILACNPPNAKYPGTNRLNVALVDRPMVIWVDDLTLNEVKQITPNSKQKDNLIRFYTDARSVIQKNNLRTTFSVRALKKITMAVLGGAGVNEAVHHGFLNGVRATAGDEGYKALLGVASTIWPEVKLRF